MDNAIKKKLIIYSIISGIFYPFLLAVNYVGIGMTIYAVLQTVLILFLTKGREEIKNKKALFMLIPIFILSLNYLISDSYIFRSYNMILIFVLYSIMVLLLSNKLEIKSSHFTFIKNIIITIFKPLMYFNIPFKWIPKTNKFSPKQILFRKIIAGILISVPLIIVVCFMLMSADLMFESMMVNFAELFDFTLDIAFAAKTILGILVGLYLFGLFYIVFKRDEELKSIDEQNSEILALTKFTIKKPQDTVIINIVLISMIFIYTVFVVIQFKYLFAQNSLPNGLTYAEYARRGFFELLFLSFINIALILIAVFFTREKIYDKKSRYATFTKGLMLYLCFITVILLISSFYRMTLYNNEYGLTRLRILVIIFLVFELLGLLITFYYIFKPKFNIIAIYSVICLSFYLIINMINIDYFIAKRNIDMYMSGKDLDYWYLSSLSADAASQMERLKDNKNSEISAAVYNYFEIAENKSNIADENWQSFNLSRYFAVKNIIK